MPEEEKHIEIDIEAISYIRSLILTRRSDQVYYYLKLNQFSLRSVLAEALKIADNKTEQVILKITIPMEAIQEFTKGDDNAS